MSGCVRCKSVSKLPIFCNSCYQESFKSGERRGHVEELHFLQYTIEADVKDNKVWKEGSQYFEIILDKIEKRLLEFEKGELK